MSKHKYVSSSLYPDQLVFISENEDSVRVKKFINAGREVFKKEVLQKEEDGINSSIGCLKKCGGDEVQKKNFGTDTGDQTVSEYLTSNESERELDVYPNGAVTLASENIPSSNTTDEFQRNRKSVSENNLLIKDKTYRGAGYFLKQLVTRSRDQVNTKLNK